MSPIIPKHRLTLSLAQDPRVKKFQAPLKPSIFIPDKADCDFTVKIREITPANLFRNGLTDDIAVVNLAWVNIDRASDFISELISQLEDPSLLEGDINVRVVIYKGGLRGDEVTEFALQHFYEATQLGLVDITNNNSLLREAALNALIARNKLILEKLPTNVN